jgi:hypothetical protein
MQVMYKIVLVNYLFAEMSGANYFFTPSRRFTKMIARQKGHSLLAGKLEDFEFRATYTIVQLLHFFEKKSEKSKRNIKYITKITKWWNIFF